MIRFCLNCIVKNEAARVTRMLDSVAKFLTAAVIVDTGSTDDTKEIIKTYCKEHGIPLVLEDAPFEDWSQARNAALTAGRRALQMHTIPVCDYFLLLDADMEIKINDMVQFVEYNSGASYDMYQVAGALHYQNRRLLSVDAVGFYKGMTHEYLDIATSGCIPEEVAFCIDHADGANRPEKFRRDIRLLKEGLKKEPNNERYFFYLAQSYRDAGKPESASVWYKKRVQAGGWDEEVWNAQLNYAYCMREMKREADFIRELLIAYNMRPSRAEPMYDLAHYYREKGENASAVIFAEAGMQILPSTDSLFVNDFVYKVGLAEEFSICAYYQLAKRPRGFAVTDTLATMATPYGGSRQLARHNLYWYLPKLSDYCSSFKSQRIAFDPPENWIAMNPSVANIKGQLACIVRTVNYRISDEGYYIIRGTDGTANSTNPINTRNYLLFLNTDFSVIHQYEIIPEDGLPCEFSLVIGFEDMRLFNWKGQLWASSTVRQFHVDGNCEQTLSRLVPHEHNYIISDVKSMLREPRQTQKNWGPISTGDTLRFLYRPGHVVDIHGSTIIENPTPGLDLGDVSGGSQLIQWENGWLSLHHEAVFIPGRQIRHYFHRFIYHDNAFKVVKVSRPFVFEDKVIEFAAGLCWHPDKEHLVISYGERDCEAKIATVRTREVSNLLWIAR